MLVTTSDQGDCTVVHLAGHLDFAATTDVRRALLKVMTNQPAAIICDLRRLTAIDRACAAVFPTAWREGGGWPSVSLSLCAVKPKVLSRLQKDGTLRFVPLHHDVGSALLATRAVPPYVSQTTHLRCDPQSARDARASARATLVQWGVRDSVDDALLVISEMVSNCVLHGEPPLRMTMRLRRGMLRIAVNDAGAGRPRPHLRSVTRDNVVNGMMLDAHGRGLAVVDSVSAAWGVTDYASGDGKSVWCELRVPSTAQ